MPSIPGFGVVENGRDERIAIMAVVVFVGLAGDRFSW